MLFVTKRKDDCVVIPRGLTKNEKHQKTFQTSFFHTVLVRITFLYISYIFWNLDSTLKHVFSSLSTPIGPVSFDLIPDPTNTGMLQSGYLSSVPDFKDQIWTNFSKILAPLTFFSGNILSIGQKFCKGLAKTLLMLFRALKNIFKQKS